jgi:hypothetical protein
MLSSLRNVTVGVKARLADIADERALGSCCANASQAVEFDRKVHSDGHIRIAGGKTGAGRTQTPGSTPLALHQLRSSEEPPEQVREGIPSVGRGGTARVPKVMHDTDCAY